VIHKLLNCSLLCIEVWVTLKLFLDFSGDCAVRLLFILFFSLSCRRTAAIPCVSVFVICTAQPWLTLFSLSSLCRAHRTCLLISNGAKHKHPSEVDEGPLYIHLSRGSRHETEPHVGVNAAQIRGAVTGFRCVCAGAGLTPDRVQIEAADA